MLSIDLYNSSLIKVSSTQCIIHAEYITLQVTNSNIIRVAYNTVTFITF